MLLMGGSVDRIAGLLENVAVDDLPIAGEGPVNL